MTALVSMQKWFDACFVSQEIMKLIYCIVSPLGKTAEDVNASYDNLPNLMTSLIVDHKLSKVSVEIYAPTMPDATQVRWVFNIKQSFPAGSVSCSDIDRVLDQMSRLTPKWWGWNYRVLLTSSTCPPGWCVAEDYPVARPTHCDHGRIITTSTITVDLVETWNIPVDLTLIYRKTVVVIGPV